jgi:NAD(P)-dependent dehydrogenase (short-subunit alcohol dehydrogenase family)
MHPGDDVSGKVAIVTGAGQGMGRAVANRLAAGGARLVINDLNAAAAERTASELQAGGAEAVAAAGDVSVAADVRRMVDTALGRYEGIDILVNNAGILRRTGIMDLEEDEWDLVLNVNLKGTYLCTRAVLPAMQRAGWGRIINFSSTAGRSVSTLGGPHYTTAKAAVLGFTRAVAKEVARHGITVNAVCPGLVDTEMVRSTIDDARKRAYAESFPIPRLGQPSEVAELVAFLASDRAAYITGASLDINGGDLMM